LSNPLAAPGVVVEVGPYRYRLVSSVRAAGEQWDALYQGYPRHAATELADFRIGLEPPNLFRRFLRANVLPDTDVAAPFQPIPRYQSLVGLEMALNWQTALGSTRYLTLHAASIAYGKNAVILPGASGSGKSTLASGLGWHGWRFMSDEFVMVSPQTGAVHPYPRPTSLKNESIAVLKAVAPAENFSMEFSETHKGTICYLRPPQAAIESMLEPAIPRALVFPHFTREEKGGLTFMGSEDAYVRLVAGSANYDYMGEAGFKTLAKLVRNCRACVMAYSSFEEADVMLKQLLRDGQDQ
jgi:HprK-related kinase A